MQNKMYVSYLQKIYIILRKERAKNKKFFLGFNYIYIYCNYNNNIIVNLIIV